MFDSENTIRKIADLDVAVSELFDSSVKHNKWHKSNGVAVEPNDIEFLEYHYHRLIRKYDVPFERLVDVKNTCLKYLDRDKAEKERQRLAKSLELYENEVQRHSEQIKNYEEWLAE